MFNFLMAHNFEWKRDYHILYSCSELILTVERTCKLDSSLQLNVCAYFFRCCFFSRFSYRSYLHYLTRIQLNPGYKLRPVTRTSYKAEKKCLFWSRRASLSGGSRVQFGSGAVFLGVFHGMAFSRLRQIKVHLSSKLQPNLHDPCATTSPKRLFFLKYRLFSSPSITVGTCRKRTRPLLTLVIWIWGIIYSVSVVYDHIWYTLIWAWPCARWVVVEEAILIMY